MAGRELGASDDEEWGTMPQSTRGDVEVAAVRPGEELEW
jgi:hypothetical protein